ncbi:hypothetical protein ACFYXH_40340 [Streptomyces sp. NPDC002730]|uniref:hypothetical protein n=1 Tax=Streptomyces sp. NPDC002730 TaxID=3364662 RepID=UPI0036BFF4CC
MAAVYVPMLLFGITEKTAMHYSCAAHPERTAKRSAAGMRERGGVVLPRLKCRPS